MGSNPPKPTILIVGAGIFGISTAYHLSLDSSSSTTITILDRAPFPPPPPPASDVNHHPLGASVDINKIVRADYSTPFYMSLAYEAIDAWSTWPFLSPYYHPTGWIMFDEKGSNLAQRIRRAFAENGREDRTKEMSFGEARDSWGGVLKETDLREFDSAYWNPGAGWVEADRAVEAMLQEAVDKGVRYLQGEVASLVLQESGHGIRGVKLEDGSVVEADKVVLATGAWTSSVLSNLEDQLGIEEGDRIEQQVKAAAVCVAHCALSADEKDKFNKMPVIIYGENGDVQPPPSSGLLKFTNAHTVTNSIITSSGNQISVPAKSSECTVPLALQASTRDIITRVMPSMTSNNRPVSHWRLCWDAITPTQHQLITKHPNSKLQNLYLAVGGSFHSWKFLPIIGKYIVNTLNNYTNGEEKDRNWGWKMDGWNKGGQDGAHEKVIPRGELRDL